MEYVIRHVETQRIEYKGQRILTEMFQILSRTPNVYCQRIRLIVGEMHRAGQNVLFVTISRVCQMLMP